MKNAAESPLLDVSVSLNYSAQTSVYPASRELDDYVFPVTAKIIGSHFPDNHGPTREVLLGELKFYLIRVGNAVNHDVSLHDVFDTTQETLDAGNAIFDSSYSDYKPTVHKLFEDPLPYDDVMLLHRLEIQPFARGQQLGLAVLIRAIEDWSSGCSLVVMKPFPLQLESNAQESKNWKTLALDSFPQNEKTAFQKLRSYYEKIGFERIGRSDFFALNTRLKWTALDELELPSEFMISADMLPTVASTA